jgi:hypothetical protein
MKVRVTRRQVALGLVAIAGAAGAAYWRLFAEDRSALDLELPRAGNPFAPSFDVFLALSQIVLVRSRLNTDAARKLHKVFVDEPWGPKHIGHAYAVLRDELARQYRNRGARGQVSFSRLQEGERWFVGHLVTTWYLGVYYHEQRQTQRLLYEDALMFDTIRGVLPIPFLENVGFGAWADPPARVDEPER